MERMRIHRLLFIAFLIVALPFLATADTGTYRILDYSVKLTPHSDGTVEMEYYQKWLVTGGHIPWITVGLPNSSYQVDQSKNWGNIKGIYPDNSSDWSGVRIDLDKDYLPNETFEVGFSLVQSKLFSADEEDYRLRFTPGWYDKAQTDRLVITLFFFAQVDRVSADPEPSRIEGQQMTWEKLNLGRGEKFTVAISFPRSFLPQATKETLRSSGRAPGFQAADGLIFFFIFVLILVIFLRIFASRGLYGRGGRIFTGGTGGARGGLSGGRSTGGGGGFGGRSSSCVCACVSCACACACAGGGGAGCSKRLSHSCPACAEKKENEE